VSLKTASRALNGEYGVAEATAERVHEAAGQLGFRLNYLARALATRQTSATVGLVIPTVSDPFFAAVAAEVEATLAPRKLGLISASHGDDMVRQRMLTRALVERRVAALVVVSAPGDSSYLQPTSTMASPSAPSTGRCGVSASTPSRSTTRRGSGGRRTGRGRSPPDRRHRVRRPAVDHARAVPRLPGRTRGSRDQSRRRLWR
jgi:hypothetical protein